MERETIQTYTKMLRDLADEQEKHNTYDMRDVATNTIRACADKIDELSTPMRNCDRGFKDAKKAEKVYWDERHKYINSISDLDRRCRAIDGYPQFAEWLLLPISVKKENEENV